VGFSQARLLLKQSLRVRREFRLANFAFAACTAFALVASIKSPAL
jgi:hypothetical protein